jgi:hypothetical protein
MELLFWGGGEGWSVKIFREEKEQRVFFIRRLSGTLGEDGEPETQEFRTDTLENIWTQWNFIVPWKHIQPIFMHEKYKSCFP